MNPEERRALAIALRALEQSDQLEGRLRATLARHGVASRLADAMVEKLHGWGLVDDARLIARFLELKLERGTLGRAGIARALVQQGLAPEAADEVVASLDDAAELRRALALLQKRYDRGGDPRKAARYLASRGFEDEVVRAAIQEGFDYVED